MALPLQAKTRNCPRQGLPTPGVCSYVPPETWLLVSVLYEKFIAIAKSDLCRDSLALLCFSGSAASSGISSGELMSSSFIFFGGLPELLRRNISGNGQGSIPGSHSLHCCIRYSHRIPAVRRTLPENFSHNSLPSRADNHKG